MRAPLKPRSDNPSRSASLPDHGPGFWDPLQSCGIDSGGEAWAALDQGVASDLFATMVRVRSSCSLSKKALLAEKSSLLSAKKLPVNAARETRQTGSSCQARPASRRWVGTCFCFRGGGERGVNPHLFRGLLHLLKSPARFSFSRNMTRAKVHPWRIANMRGIDGEQKFRLCWFGNLSPGFAH